MGIDSPGIELDMSRQRNLWAKSPAVLRAIAAFLIIIWVVELLDVVVFSDHLQRNGIRPRRSDGLDGILWMPFLHSDWRHLISNTFPFAILGGLVGLRGTRYWVATMVIIAILGGALTWLFAGGGNHIGASGLVFGLFGSLMGAAFFERRIAIGATALVAILLYGGMIQGLAPQPGISWEGHGFGAVAGIVAAKLLAGPRHVRAPLPEPPLDDPYWEI